MEAKESTSAPEVNVASKQANAPAVSQDSSILTETIEASSSDKTPSYKRGKCKYCTSYLPPGAKVCLVCNRHKNWFWQHFRVDHIGIVATLIMVLFAASNLKLTSKNLELASANLEETKQKRVEATEALAKANEAKSTAAQLEAVLKDAQATLSELQANFEVTVLRTQALNDDSRYAFDRIKAIISQSGLASNLASQSFGHILDHLYRTNFISPSLEEFPLKSEHFFKGQFHTMSLEELHTVHQRLPPKYKPSYLTMLWKDQRFTKLELLSILANVIKTTSSLHELYRACELMNLEAKIIKFYFLEFNPQVCLRWWEQNKSRYESSPPAVMPGDMR